jgi:undecaprenyl-diphosphatase
MIDDFATDVRDVGPPEISDPGLGDPAIGDPDIGDPGRGTMIIASAGIVILSLLVVFMLTALVQHGTGFRSYDFRLLRDFRRHQNPHLVDAANALADFGTVGTLIVLGVVAGLLLRWRGLNAILCAVPLTSLLVSGALVQIMKDAIVRVGPNAQLGFGSPTVGSFPSGHSADTTALSISLAIVLVAVLVRRPAERIVVFGLAVALSVAVGLSRLVLGVHWPTDVVAGWAIGLGTAVAIGTVAVILTADRPFAVTPPDALPAEPSRDLRSRV